MENLIQLKEVGFFFKKTIKEIYDNAKKQLDTCNFYFEIKNFEKRTEIYNLLKEIENPILFLLFYQIFEANNNYKRIITIHDLNTQLKNFLMIMKTYVV